MIQGRKSIACLSQVFGKWGADGATGTWDENAGTEPIPVAVPGRMPVRRQKLVLLLLVQLAFSSGLWLAAREAAILLYPREALLSYPLIVPQVLFFLCYFLLNWRSIYSRDYHYYLRRAHGKVLKNAIIPAALASACFLALGAGKIVPIPLAAIFLAAGLVSFAFADGCQYLWIRYLSGLGYFRKKVLVIGRSGVRLSADTRARDLGPTKVLAGEIDRSNGAWLWRPAGGGAMKVVRDFAQIRTIILRESIGDILLFPGGTADRVFERQLVEYCQEQAISYTLVLQGAGPAKNGISNLLFPNLPASERCAGPRDSLTAVSVKRLLDVAISLVCLALFLPAGLFISLAILVRDGLPVLYVSTRIGKNGRPIRFFKFRTMVRGAEKEKEKLLAFNARSDGPLFKMRNDPRVTRTGGLLRRYSLDEFPQFLNVLMGTMSLVGPRPHLPQEVAEYREGDYLRLECMPGIVGLPQVSGSNTTMGFREWVDLDLSYRRGWSLALDVSIIVKTITLFFRGLFSGRGVDHY